jgi:predicted phage baseplate assembly protein
VTRRVQYDHVAARARPAAKILAQQAGDALPAVTLRAGGETWEPVADLLASDRFAQEFVVETERDDGASLRFGDGVLGRRPAAGTSFALTLRQGGGPAGNVGADALRHVVTSEAVVAVRNPLPATGGQGPESAERIRLAAPVAFRTQARAVTEADYQAMTERHPQVQKAMATRRWTGSWYTMFVTVDRRGGAAVDATFEGELRAFLEPVRLAGHDLEIDGPRFVALDVALRVCVRPGYVRADVQEALLDAFGSAERSVGGRGFFHPDNVTFGQPIYLSAVIAAAMAVPGVAWVEPVRFQRWGKPARGEIADGRIAFDRLEIARLDNDRNAPEHGKLELVMEGGL